MKSSKERKNERKMARERMTARKTEESRARRLANKAKRIEIISINPEAKIDIINQETYVDGVKVEVIDNRIVPVILEPEVVVAADEGEVNVIEKIESHNKSAIERLTDRFRKK